jgi:hypothetical protein
LEVLDISYNKLGGPLPEPFAAMGSLRELLLDVNQLSGALPEVRNWTLRVWGHTLVPEAFAGMGLLRELLLDVNQLSGTLPEVNSRETRVLGEWFEPWVETDTAHNLA